MSNIEAIAVWDLAKKIKSNDKCELTAEEAVKIQSNLASRWAHPGIIAQAHRMLEQ